MITGQQQPDAGEVKIGQTVKMAYVDQSRDCLDGSKTVFDELAQGATSCRSASSRCRRRAYIGRFNFKGADQAKLVGNLSGGERGRLHLAKTLMAGGNVLLLDEPSNDLDVKPCARWKTPCSNSRARWSSRTTAGSSTASARIRRRFARTFFPGNYQKYEEQSARSEEGRQAEARNPPQADHPPMINQQSRGFEKLPNRHAKRRRCAPVRYIFGAQNPPAGIIVTLFSRCFRLAEKTALVFRKTGTR